MLEILNKEDLNEEELSFVNLHNKILANAQMTGVYLYEFCKELKEMRDSKKYIYAGLSNFEEYAINVLGLKKSQAYNFCSIAENINPEIFQSIGKIGTTKLLLISKLGLLSNLGLQKRTTKKRCFFVVLKLKLGPGHRAVVRRYLSYAIYVNAGRSLANKSLRKPFGRVRPLRLSFPCGGWRKHSRLSTHFRPSVQSRLAWPQFP